MGRGTEKRQHWFMTYGRRELIHYIWKPERARHQRHLYDVESEWSHKQNQGSRGGAGLGGESTSLISYTLSAAERVPRSCLLGFGRPETVGQRESRLGCGHFGVLSASLNWEVDTELITVACRICGWPTSCQLCFLRFSSSSPSFLPFSLFLCS